MFSRTLLSTAVLASVIGLAGCDGDDGRDGLDGQAGTSQTLIELNVLGSYASGIFGESAAEIVAHDPGTQRLFVVNAASADIDVLDVNDPANPLLLSTIDTSSDGGEANSVDVKDGLVAVAIAAPLRTDNGRVVFYDAVTLEQLSEVTVGALPDMLVFTRDGQKVLVANEGEPSDDYLIDPEGSVSIIDLSQGAANPTVTTADFTAFNGQEEALRERGVRIFGPGASAAQDFEPEYIALSADGKTAWVALQENNAAAVLDIEAGEITEILPFGFKDFSILGNELDASDRDGRISIRNWPVFGIYQPDAIASYAFNGKTYYITANEGDARDYAGWSEEFRVKDLTLSGDLADWVGLQDDENLGRLRVTSTLGVSNGCDPSDLATDVEAECEYDTLYAYGARSFSIWSEEGRLVFDSGSEFERITARVAPEFFNSNNSANNFEARSDDKGPEPEGVTVGVINGQTFAFIGLERVGGIMVYNVTNPQNPQFVQYINNRDFSVANDQIENGLVGDLGAEGLTFISAENSPNGKPVLVVGNEVSGTTTLFGIDVIELSAN
ncbi:choice-of-anchor I family protein [Marinobacter sp. NSM]|uniref:choice-of-anchor I family protein n=1 Tax=Marinobacter sp. NSM TaxID=3458004 RepID=UPI004036F4D9